MSPKVAHDGLQVLVSSGEEERVIFGLNMALAAVASDVQVTVFFALESARWVCAQHGVSGRVQELLTLLFEYQVDVHCCSACAHAHCQSEGEESHLLDGVQRAGLASLVMRATGTCQTITI